METLGTGQGRRQKSQEFYKGVCRLTAVGGLAFWMTDSAISLSPIAPEYEAAFSISYLPTALAEALAGGLVIACCVNYFPLRLFDKIPTKNSVLKSGILSLFAMVFIEVPSALANPGNSYVYLVVDTGVNAPRFLALAVAIGYLCERGIGGEATQDIAYGVSQDFPQTRTFGSKSLGGSTKTGPLHERRQALGGI